MNEKLKAWQGKLSDLRPSPARDRGISKTNALVTISASTDHKNKVDLIRVSLHRRALELTGWKDHDRMDAAIDGNQMVVFRSETGPRLCRSSGGGKSKTPGTRRYIRFPMPHLSTEGFPKGECSEVETGPGRIAFNLPASSEE